MFKQLIITNKQQIDWKFDWDVWNKDKEKITEDATLDDEGEEKNE